MADDTVTRMPLPPWWRQYAILFAAALRAALVYRTNIVGAILGSIVLHGTQILFLTLLLDRFGDLGGWSLGEIALLFAVRACAHACSTVPFGEHLSIDRVVRDGEFDSYLLRPVSPFVQLITRRFHPGTIGDLLLGVGTLAIAVNLVSVEWTIGTIAWLVAAILAGSLVESGIQIALSGLAFRVRSTFAIKVTLDHMFSSFGSYPLVIFGQIGSYLLTFAVPLAFMGYLPVASLLGRTDELWLPAWFVFAPFVVGPLVFALGLLLFHRGIRHYTSPGS